MSYYSLGTGAPLFLLGCLLAAVLIFLLLREFVTWYWKINESIEVLKDVNTSLKHIATAITRLNPEEKNESPKDIPKTEKTSGQK